MKQTRPPFIPVLFFLFGVLSLPFAYLAVACHSYGRTPGLFVVDIIFRIFFFVFPAPLFLSAYGFYREKDWKTISARWAAINLLGILICFVVIRWGFS